MKNRAEHTFFKGCGCICGNKTVICDRCIALLLTVMLGLLAFFNTTDRPFFGDDYAAYISEGIAIAEGTYEEQLALNFRRHASGIGNEKILSERKLTYAWGYPLLISGVYRLIGFDRTEYTSFRWYKLITVVPFAVACGAFYLLCRRRFGAALSLICAVFFGTWRILYEGIDMYYSDILFVSLTVITFFLAELYAEQRNGLRSATGILLTVTLFLTAGVRVNGFSVGLAAFIGLLIARRKQTPSERMRLSSLLLPFLLAFSAVLLTECFYFGFPLDAASVRTDLSGFISNLRYAVYTVRDWIAENLYMTDWPYLRHAAGIEKLLAYAVMLTAGVGVLTDGLRRDPHLTIFAFGNLIGMSLLPYAYDQGGRYQYLLLPFVVLFFGCGAKAIASSAVRLITRLKARGISSVPDDEGTGSVIVQGRAGKAGHLFTVGFGIFSLIYALTALTVCLKHGSERALPDASAFTDGTKRMYDYIREEIPQDAVIITQKPRLLALVTERDCIARENGHTVDEADYVLDIVAPFYADDAAEPVYSSGGLKLYKLR